VVDLPVLAAVAVVVGGVAAVTARSGRVVVLGLMLAGMAASVAASPLPDGLSIAARIVGSLLAAYLLWAAVGAAPSAGAGSPLGPLSQAAAAAAAFAIGVNVRPVTLDGPDLTALIAAQAAGFALVALAIAPLAGRDVFRAGVGVALLALGCSLLFGVWSGPVPALEHLALAALLVGIAGATSLLIPMAPGASEARAADAAAVGAGPAGVVASRRATPLRAPEPAAPIGLRTGDVAQPLRRAAAGPQMPPPGPTQPRIAVEPQPALRRPMTADPIEADAWAAWSAPEPEPTRRPPSVRRAPLPDQAQPKKPEPKKPTRSRPNLGGKP
jgi:hypothetical protein